MTSGEDVKRVVGLAVEVVKRLGTSGIVARLFGGCAVGLSTERSSGLVRLGTPKDIDVVVWRKDLKAASSALQEDGWLTDRRSALFESDIRLRLLDPDSGVPLDLYAEPLRFNQVLRLGSRLALCPLSLACADLLLSKLQIAEASSSDDFDVIAILASNPPGKDPCSEIEVARLIEASRQSWGFHHSIVCGLNRVNRLVQTLTTPLVVREEVSLRISKILDFLEYQPRSVLWRMRSRIGERLPWYSRVDT